MVLRTETDVTFFRPATLRLGEIHYLLLKAANLIEARRWNVYKAEGGIIVKSDLTEFGKEVGLDEINWWIVKKETDRAELRRRTEQVLQAA